MAFKEIIKNFIRMKELSNNKYSNNLNFKNNYLLNLKMTIDCLKHSNKH